MSTFESTPLQPNSTPKFAGQYLVFTAYESSTAPDRFVIEVYENTTVGTQGTKIGEFFLTPNTNDRSHFDLSNVVAGRLSAPVNATGGGVVHGHDFTGDTASLTSSDRVAREYRLRLFNYTGSKSVEQDSKDICLIPGARQISEGLLSYKERFFLMLNATSKAFLTDRGERGEDIEMHMADDDEGVVAIFQPDQYISDTNVDRFLYTVYHPGGTVQDELSVSSSTTVNDNYQLGCIGPAQVAQLFGSSWPSDWTKIEVEMRATDAVSVRSKLLVIHKDCRPIKHDPVQLTWANTVGGWDYLRFDGRNLKTVNSEAKRYRKTLGNYDASTFSFNSYDRQDTPYHLTAREQYALRNQFFTAEERELLQYCFRSKEVMFRVGTGDWLPCNVQTSSYTVQPTASRLFDVSFNIELAQEIRC